MATPFINSLHHHMPSNSHLYSASQQPRVTAFRAGNFKGRAQVQAGNQKFKHRKLKVINSWPKGLSRKFEKKVKKALAVNDTWGKYVYLSRFRLRQQTIDQHGIQSTDENGQLLEFGSPKQYMDAASILYNNKVPAPDWNVATNNISSIVKLELVNSHAEMFFKSSSGHVVHLEVFECSPRTTNDDQNAITDAAQSYNGLSSKQLFGPSPPVQTTMDIAFLGASPEDMLQLHLKWKVKIHKVKLLPGESTSLSFQGLKNYTYDVSKDLSTGNLPPFSSKTRHRQFFFRILNDISVSKDSGSVYHWPSNNSGGVACQFKRTYTMRPPPAAINDATIGNIIVNGIWRVAPGASSDQQISYNNPVQNANTDI